MLKVQVDASGALLSEVKGSRPETESPIGTRGTSAL